jgi:hypothetical protein
MANVDALIAATATQIDNLKKMIEAKKTHLASVRARDEDSLEKLREEVIRLREVVEDKRKYVEAAKAEYKRARRSGAPRQDPPPDVIATAILSFPDSTDVSIEYGDIPLDCLKPLHIKTPF